MNHRELYKRGAADFGNANAGRLARAGRHEEQRRHNRAVNVARHRDIASDAGREAPSSHHSDLCARLIKWKEEQRLKKKIEEQKRKPIFKVGIVHHKVYSPPFSDRFTKKSRPDHPEGAKRVLTKSFAPHNYTFSVPRSVQIMKGRSEWQTAAERSSQASSAPVTNKNSSTNFRPGLSSKDESTEEAKVEDKSPGKVVDFINPQIAQVVNVRIATPRSGTPVPASVSLYVVTSRGKVNVRTATPRSGTPVPASVSLYVVTSRGKVNVRTATPRSGTPVPASHSPYVVTSRGKDSARKEPTNRMSIRRSSANEIPTTAKKIKSKELPGNVSRPPKSSRKGDFDEAAEVARALIDGNRDLGRSLARTYSCDSNENFVEPYDIMRNVTVRTIKKRLDFENESFDESANTNIAESAATLAAVPESTVIPDIVFTLPTPVKTSMMKTSPKDNRW